MIKSHGIVLPAWSGLSLTGQLLGGTTSEGGKDVLVAGASGGVGTLAVQMLKAHGSRVVAICSDDAYELVSGLGADVVLDYKSEQVWSLLCGNCHFSAFSQFSKNA